MYNTCSDFVETKTAAVLGSMRNSFHYIRKQSCVGLVFMVCCANMCPSKLNHEVVIQYVKILKPGWRNLKRRVDADVSIKCQSK